MANAKEIPRAHDVVFMNSTPVQQADIKARLLLLNERPTENNSRSPFSGYNSVPENYINPLFALYHHLGRKPDQFNQVAPLVASWYLQMGSMVTDIFRLEIHAKGSKLIVDFEGQRNSQYQEDPGKIAFKGQCEMPDYLPAEALPLRLSN